jgi:Domain of unknown function (DUF1707)
VRGAIRASDADREAVAEALRRHCAEGRLTVEELEERVGVAYTARTERELARLLRDLPERCPRRQWRPRALPAVRPFLEEHTVDARRKRVYRDAIARVVPRMTAGGYELVESVEPHLLVFELRKRPAWAYAACLLTFPLGLAALAVEKRERVELAFVPAPGGRTRVTVHGARGLRGSALRARSR